MRIITGSLKGRNIPVPGNTDIRPTKDRVKESLFGIISSRRYIEECTILDLFAGSGNLGFEALSRGAKQIFFVDHNQKCLNHIKKAAIQFNVENRINTICMKVADYLTGPPIPCDIIFADPPYAYPNIEGITELLFEHEWVAENGWVVLEHSKYHHFTGNTHFLMEKKYGRTFVTFFLEQSLKTTL